MSTKLKWILALVFIIIGFLAASVAAGNPYWVEGDSYHEGLWYLCITIDLLGPRTACAGTTTSRNPSWYQGVQAAAAISEVCYIIAIILLLSFACCRKTTCSYTKHYMIGFMIIGIICQIVTVAIYGWKANDDYKPVEIMSILEFDLAWCFYLYIVSIVMMAVGTGFLYQIPAQDQDDRMMGASKMAPGMTPEAGSPPIVMQPPQ